MIQIRLQTNPKLFQHLAREKHNLYVKKKEIENMFFFK